MYNQTPTPISCNIKYRPIMLDASAIPPPDFDIVDGTDDSQGGGRKTNKPLMEKRRRARINRSLMELKTILMDSMKKATPGHSKWEKADILEMTVQYVHCLRNQQQSTKRDALSVGQFLAGYSECIRQVQKYKDANVSRDEGGPKISNNALVAHEKLLAHLLYYLNNINDEATTSMPATGKLELNMTGLGQGPQQDKSITSSGDGDGANTVASPNMRRRRAPSLPLCSPTSTEPKRPRGVAAAATPSTESQHSASTSEGASPNSSIGQLSPNTNWAHNMVPVPDPPSVDSSPQSNSNKPMAPPPPGVIRVPAQRNYLGLLTAAATAINPPTTTATPIDPAHQRLLQLAALSAQHQLTMNRGQSNSLTHDYLSAALAASTVWRPWP